MVVSEIVGPANIIRSSALDKHVDTIFDLCKQGFSIADITKHLNKDLLDGDKKFGYEAVRAWINKQPEIRATQKAVRAKMKEEMVDIKKAPPTAEISNIIKNSIPTNDFLAKIKRDFGTAERPVGDTGMDVLDCDQVVYLMACRALYILQEKDSSSFDLLTGQKLYFNCVAFLENIKNHDDEGKIKRAVKFNVDPNSDLTGKQLVSFSQAVEEANTKIGYDVQDKSEQIEIFSKE